MFFVYLYFVISEFDYEYKNNDSDYDEGYKHHYKLDKKKKFGLKSHSLKKKQLISEKSKSKGDKLDILPEIVDRIQNKTIKSKQQQKPKQKLMKKEKTLSKKFNQRKYSQKLNEKSEKQCDCCKVLEKIMGQLIFQQQQFNQIPQNFNMKRGKRYH